MATATARARRFDQGARQDVVVTVLGLVVIRLFFMLGRYLKTVDNQLVDFD